MGPAVGTEELSVLPQLMANVPWDSEEGIEAWVAKTQERTPTAGQSWPEKQRQVPEAVCPQRHQERGNLLQSFHPETSEELKHAGEG